MKLYNTLSQNIEEFTPINDKIVKMYTCGLTVYSQPQIGNWVAYIYSDILNRVLIADGYKVNRVQNITDVGHLVSDDDAGEDKMEKGARAEGLTAWDVAEKYIKVAHDEAKLLDLLQPSQIVRATSLIDEQIDFIRQLENKGYTYVINDGVYFDTSKLNDYGKLARLDIKGLQAGARVDVGGKKHPTDFALWKLSPSEHKRDMEWDSPWGKGFPGWHLECSVIARESLGDQIDLHTGGIDHIPVHHTNEIAQTETLTGKTFCRYWFHNNHMKVNGTKLAKSLGNSYTLNDILDKGFSLYAFKVLVLSSHYRTEGNFSWEILEAAQNRLHSFEQLADRALQADNNGKDITFDPDSLLQALNDDLDTPKVLNIISGVVNTVSDKKLSISASNNLRDYLKTVDSLLGLKLSERKDISLQQKAVLGKRAKAREINDWSTSDKLRDQLLEEGVEINDTPQGQVWSRSSSLNC